MEVTGGRGYCHALAHGLKRLSKSINLIKENI